MVILGLADGLDAGAALVRGDEILGVVRQSSVDGQPRSRAFPWDAVQRVLFDAGVRREQVEALALAGRFTPPFFVRRHPGVHAFTNDPFSSLHGPNLFWQRVLRSSGLGALEADRARDWVDQRAQGHGIHAQRVVLVDVHKALAAAAYRTQAQDDALVVVLHPRGDGLLGSVHRGRSGQLNRVHEVQDLGSLHVHLARAQATLGLDPWTGEAALWQLAASGEAHPVLVNQLRQELWFEEGQIRGAGTFVGSPEELPWSDLRAAPREDAAASVRAHLKELASAFVAYAVERFGRGKESLVVAGAWMANPRLLGDLAELDGVARVHGAPLPGHASRALGAALDVAGAAPRERSLVSEEGCPAPAEALDALRGGEPVVRWMGPPLGARHGAGAASVLVTPDRARAVGDALHAVGEPALVTRPGTLEGQFDAHQTSVSGGMAALAVHAVPAALAGLVAADGRAHVVHATATLADLVGASGVPGLAAWPVAVGDAAPNPRDLDRVMRIAGARWIEDRSGWRRR